MYSSLEYIMESVSFALYSPFDLDQTPTSDTLFPRFISRQNVK